MSNSAHNRYLGIICLLSLLWLGGCSEGSVSPLSTSNSAPVDGTVTNLGSVTNVGPVVTPQPATAYDPAKTFIFGLAQEPVGLNQTGFDPANLTDRDSLLVTRQLYEGLFEPKADSTGYQWSALIKNVGQSDDGRVYHIRLRKGVVFSDGTPLDAAAVKFNFDRWSSESNIFHKGDFETWRRFWRGFPGNLSGVEVVDTINLTITLKTAWAGFYQVLAMPQFAIVAPSAFSSAGDFKQPIGSGPYLVNQIIRDAPRRLILRTNPNFVEQRQDINQLPKTSPIVVQVLGANEDGLKELKDGHISATDKIRPEQAQQTDPSYQIKFRQPLDVTFLAMNQSKAPFDNRSVRLAFASALDPTVISSAFLGLGQPANGILPLAAFAYRNEQSAYSYDPSQARKLLAQAGYANGLTVDLWVLPDPRPYYPDPAKVAEAIRKSLAAVGVTVRVQNEDWATFYQSRDDGNLSFFMGGWQGVNGDPDEFFQAIFNQAQRANGYLNPILASLIGQGQVATDPNQRRDVYRQASDIVFQDVPLIPLDYVKEPLAVRFNVNGYALNPSGVDKWATITLK